MFFQFVSFLLPSADKEECNLKIEETPRQVVDASIKTPLNTNSLSHCIHLPLSVSNVKTHNYTPPKIRPRKLALPENENDDLGKENTPTATRKPATKTRIRAHKQQKPKTVFFWEDCPISAQKEKLPTINSGVTQKSGRTLRSKTSQKETHSRHTASKHESLSSMSQLLETRIDGPGNYSKIHEVSVNRKQENTSVRNVKALTPNVIDEETNSTNLGLQGLEPLPVLEEAARLNRKPSTSEIFCNTHTPVLKAPRSLRTYTRQNNKVQLKEKSQTSQKIVNEEAVVKRPKDDESMHKKIVGNSGKQACSSRKGVKKISPHSSQSERKTRGGGKSDGSHASASSPCKSSGKENSNVALMTQMENLVLESEKDKCSKSNDVEQASSKGMSCKKSNKGSQFLFTPSGKTVRKEHDETIVVSSSPDEQVDVCAKQSIKHPKKKKEKEWKEKVIPSSASEDEMPPELKSDTSNEEEEVALKKIMPKKGVSLSKKRRLPLRHRFLLN
jgi:hypothetical protein